MLQVDRVEQLMAEVGPAAGLLVVDAYTSEGMWHIAVDEDTEVIIEMAPERGVLVVMGQIGKPAGGDLKALYELLLRYAHVWHASQGLRMSLDAPDGTLWLLFDCTAQDISAIEFGRLLTEFAVKLKVWREIVAADPDVPGEPQRLENVLDPGLLRG